MNRICDNCRLWDPEEGACSITVIIEGEDHELMTKPDDWCYWERYDLVKEIKQVKSWSDGQDGFIETPRSTLWLPKI